MSVRAIARKRAAQEERQTFEKELAECKRLSTSDPQRLLEFASSLYEKACRADLNNVQAQALLYCAEASHRLGKHEDTCRYLQQAENILPGDSSDCRLSLHDSWGQYYLERGELLNAYEYFCRTLQFSHSPIHAHRRCHVFNSLGLVFARVGTYDTALRYYYQGLELAEQEEYTAILAPLYANIGSAYYQLGDNDKALEHFSVALALHIEQNDLLGTARQSKNIAIIHRLRQNYPPAMEFFERGLEIWRKIGNPKKEADILTNIGMICAESGDVERGLAITQEALCRADTVKDSWEYAFVLSNLGSIHHMRKEYDQALEAFFASLQLFGRMNMRRYENEVRKLIADLYEESGDYQESLKYEKHYSRVREELQGIEMQRSVAELEMGRALQKAEEEKERLRRLEKTAREEIERQAKKLNAITVNLTEREGALKKIREELRPLLQATEEKTRKNASRIMRYIDDAVSQDERSIFQEQFEQVYQEFIRRLREICPELTAAEIRICVLIKMNLSTKQIAEILFASPLTVKTHRTHIRRKLRLNDGESLSTLLFAL